MTAKPGKSAKVHAGQMAFHGGLAAEAAVERLYIARGLTLAARRWRGTSGEIDLIFEEGDGLVFVEVKKSGRFRDAALRISDAQRRRIFATATEFVAERQAGQMSDMRFDVALCNGIGEIEILSNALFEE